jgi:hypothetical protein
VYSDDIALVRPGRVPVVGRQVELLPEAIPDVQESGKSRRVGLAPGSKAGGATAAVWRDWILVLFRGRTANHHRIVDLYRSADLTYDGSILLPILASDITASGDTLAVLGEVDDEPVLNVYLLMQVASPARRSK